MQKLHSIQFLRAVAALSVMFFHIVGAPLTIGAAGVDVFFVISGFVMGMVGDKATPTKFLRHRLFRIVPLYWAVTLLMCLGALAGVFSTFTFTMDHLWKSLLFIPYADASGQVTPLVMVGWTLNMEMFFYLVFALGLALRAPISVTIIVLTGMVCLGQLADWQSPFMQIWASPLLLEFLAGLVLSQIAFAGVRSGAAALVLSFVGFAFAAGIGEQSGLLRIASWGVPAVLLVAGCVWIERAGGWPIAWLKPFEIIGDASYALYLLHGLVISVVYKIIAPGPAAGIVVVFAALAVSVAAHLLFEKPVIRLLRKFANRGIGGQRAEAVG